MVNLWPTWQGAWQQADRHGTEAVAECLLIHKQRAEEQSETGLGVNIWMLKAHAQWHTPSNKDMPLNPSEIVHQLDSNVWDSVRRGGDSLIETVTYNMDK